MKKSIVVLFSMLCIASAKGQDIPFQITKSEISDSEYVPGMELDEITGEIFIESGEENYRYEHYDVNLKLIGKHNYESERGYTIGLIINGGKIIRVNIESNKEQQAFVCTAYVASTNDFKFTATELFRVQQAGAKEDWLKPTRRGHPVSMAVSKNKTAFAISVDFSEKKTEIHKIYTFDTNLNLKMDHTADAETNNKLFMRKSVDVSDDGAAVYVFGEMYSDRRNKSPEGFAYTYKLIRINNSDVKTYLFNADDGYYVSDLRMIPKGNKLAYAGFYSNTDGSGIKGLCYFEIDSATLEASAQKYSPFTEQFLIDKFGKNTNEKMYNFTMKDLLLTTNNEVVLTAEETSTFKHQASGGMGHTTSDRNDIISAKFGSSGDLVWLRNIDKNQSSSSVSYLSFTATTKGNNSYFFVNTDEAVKNLGNSRVQFNFTNAKKSNVNIIRIDEKGDLDYKEVLDDQQNAVPFLVGRGIASKRGDSVYFMGWKGKKKQLLKIVLN
jgi:hypothetical protein